jgi:hypothetical protein
VRAGTWSTGAAARLASASTGSMLYGAVVTAAVLVTAGGHDSSTGRVLAAWGFVLGTYWLTDIYVHAAESQFHGDSRNILLRSATAARAEVGVLEGGVPAMAVFLVAAYTGNGTLGAEKVALYFTVVLLAVVGYVGARHAGRSARSGWSEAGGAAVLGLLMVAAKTFLH